MQAGPPGLIGPWMGQKASVCLCLLSAHSWWFRVQGALSLSGEGILQDQGQGCRGASYPVHACTRGGFATWRPQCTLDGTRLTPLVLQAKSGQGPALLWQTVGSQQAVEDTGQPLLCTRPGSPHSETETSLCSLLVGTEVEIASTLSTPGLISNHCFRRH